jgi:hypothetical protein
MTSNAKQAPQGSGARKQARATLTFAQFEALCDDPARDLACGRNVRAILTYRAEQGFFLAAEDGPITHDVTEANGERVRFRTIEQAFARLCNVSGLSPDIGLVLLRDAR